MNPLAHRNHASRQPVAHPLAWIWILVIAVSLLWCAMQQSASARIPFHPPFKYCTGHHRPRGCISVPKPARRPPGVNQQGGPSLTPAEVADGGGLGGGPGEGRSTALEWTHTQLGSKIWAYRCERFIEEAFGTRYVFASAWVAAQHVALHRTAPSSAPPGALVFFGPVSANRGDGHVGLSLGGGRMISALETVRVTDISSSRYWRSLYVGWAYAPSNWPGRLPPPPGATAALSASEVKITAPAFGSTLSGTVTLEASASGANGVAFEAYYATDTSNPLSVGWHLLGDAVNQGGSWGLEWDTHGVPDQGSSLLGTINVSAIALGPAGELTGTRDYRRIAVVNGAGPLTPSPEGGSNATPTVFPETTGGVSHTWTNYTNAGGNEGPAIPSNATVNIACKITGFAVADGNTWWYRIASTPWNNAYYVSADAFYNNGQTSGSLKGTPFVDPAVSSC